MEPRDPQEYPEVADAEPVTIPLFPDRPEPGEDCDRCRVVIVEADDGPSTLDIIGAVAVAVGGVCLAAGICGLAARVFLSSAGF